jgi:hypothetical protein
MALQRKCLSLLGHFLWIDIRREPKKLCSNLGFDHEEERRKLAYEHRTRDMLIAPDGPPIKKPHIREAFLFLKVIVTAFENPAVAAGRAAQKSAAVPAELCARLKER